MRQNRYLEVILTVNAVLLAALVWVQLAGHAPLESAATAQSASDNGTGIPNAGAQRQKMIETLRDLDASVQSMRKTLEGGKLKVQVTNISELKSDGN